jgi:hypothetical protein
VLYAAKASEGTSVRAGHVEENTSLFYLFLAKILMGFLPQIMFQRRNLQQIRKMRTALVTS